MSERELRNAPLSTRTGFFQQVTGEPLPLPPRPVRRERQRNVLPLLIALGIFALWFALTQNEGASFVVASPQAVVRQFVTTLTNGTLLRHLGTTLAEIGIGLAIGMATACTLGYSIAHSHLLERAIGPYAVGFQAVPIVAIAPVLIRIFGPGLLSNGIVCALIVFFPMLINTIVGIRNIDPTKVELMRALSASRWQTFIWLEIPSALPVIFGGLKISATLAVIGAVVGEAVSAQAGLGYLIYSARYVYDTSLVMVGIFTLTGLALALYEIVSRLERWMLRWQPHEE